MVPMKNGPLGGKGFTLLELLVVVAILSLLGWLSIPAMVENYKKEQVNALTIGLASWLQEVRSAALNGSFCEVLVSDGPITNGGTVAQIVGETIPEGDTIPENCDIPSNPYLIPESAQGATYNISANPDDSFWFTYRGTKFPDTCVLITIAMANNGPSRSIQLNGLLGDLEIGNASSSSCDS
jgi:prepilin-type N-terminal cleavage/methylation domain-containing protein